jgi:hypothetical protein
MRLVLKDEPSFFIVDPLLKKNGWVIGPATLFCT